MIDQAILSTENGNQKDGKIVCPRGCVGITAEVGQGTLFNLEQLLWDQFPENYIAFTPQHPIYGYVLEFGLENKQRG